MSAGDENLEELIEFYTSEDSVESAMREKTLSEKSIEDIGVLVKGYPLPQRELDLHGKIQTEAMIELDNFIKLAINHHIRTVRVITGKGLHSKHMFSVLPEMTEKKLSEMRKAKKILAFRREKTGGSFAVYLIS